MQGSLMPSMRLDWRSTTSWSHHTLIHMPPPAGTAVHRANSISNYLVKLAPGAAEAREHFAPPRRQTPAGSGIAESRVSPAGRAAQHPSGCGRQADRQGQPPWWRGAVQFSAAAASRQQLQAWGIAAACGSCQQEQTGRRGAGCGWHAGRQVLWGPEPGARLATLLQNLRSFLLCFNSGTYGAAIEQEGDRPGPLRSAVLARPGTPPR